jgi:hypothetical protein
MTAQQTTPPEWSTYGEAEDYVVAIPSFQRAAGLEAKTLTFLREGGVDLSRVHVFLHAYETQTDEYEALAARTGITLQQTDKVGITAQRTGIPHFFKPGTPIVHMDDDVTGIVEAIDTKHLRDTDDVHSFFRRMFEETHGRGLWVWGLAPVINPFYMRAGHLGEGLKFLIFSLYGSFARPGHPVYDHRVKYKDEHEFSLRAWWYDGAVVRHDGAAARANFMTDPGGCQGDQPAGHARDWANVEASIEQLEADWPGLIRRNTRKKDTGFTEITLAPKKRKGRANPFMLPGAATE